MLPSMIQILKTLIVEQLTHVRMEEFLMLVKIVKISLAQIQLSVLISIPVILIIKTRLVSQLIVVPTKE